VRDDGQIVKQFNYAPFGKVLNTADVNRTKFIGKEKDKESNYADHGVRKYDDEIGRFTSIDPLWEKYYSLTPYQYAGNNPVSFLDGNGMLIYATGETAVDGVKEMNEELSFTVTRNEETGQLSVPEGTEGKSDMEKKLIEAIKDTKVIVDLSFTSDNTMNDVNGWEQQVMGGMYGGSKKNDDGTVQAKQGVNIEHFKIAESTGGDKVGKNIIHEALEGYIGGKEKPGGNYSNSYSFSHNRAMSIFPLSRTGFNVSHVEQKGGVFGSSVKFYINNKYAYTIQFPFLQKLYENRNK